MVPVPAAVPPEATARAVSVVVDARGLRLSGIGRYLREVVGALLGDPRFGRVTLAGDPAELHAFLEERGGRERAGVVAFPHGLYSAAAQAHWGLLQLRGIVRADAALFPHFDVPLTDRSPGRVVTVQDLGHFRLAEQFAAWKVAAASHVLSAAVRRAARVVVTSRATLRDLLERHPEVAPRVSVIPLGVADPRPTPTPARAAEIDAWRPFLLCVGNRKPHKNLVAAVETLARLRSAGDDVRLVIVGQDFGQDAEVLARCRAAGVEDSIVWFGEASEAELSFLYSRAGCLLFPSLFEGFGLPPLEAMAAGLPVVASDRASIPEVVGDAAALVDPMDWDAMAGAARALLHDGSHRAEMVRRGRARAAAFRWSETAARVGDLLCEAAREGAARQDTALSARPGPARAGR